MKSHLVTAVALLLGTGVAVGAWGGCSASDDPSEFGTGAGGSGAGTTSTGTGGTTTTLTGLGGLNNGGSTGAGGTELCTSVEVETKPVPLDMLVLLDESGSMDDGIKWPGVTAALKTFINDPASSGISVGFEVFPVESFDDCNYFDYENLLVPIAELPGNAPSLITAIDAESPQGGTPTYGALKGALFVATGHQDANPDHKVIVVFVSDGDPTSCSITDIASISALAKSAFNYNGVQTYAVAIQGSTIANLNAIAAAGGTGQAYDVTANVQQFSQKMAEIRSQALSCELAMPEAPVNEELDVDDPYVDYLPGGNGMPEKLKKVPSKSDCGPGEGFYYDNPSAPTKIILCPASCQKVQADLEAKLSIGFPCKDHAN